VQALRRQRGAGLQKNRIRQQMLEGYFPILMFIAVGLAFGVAPVVAGWIASRAVGSHKPDEQKLSPYECGFEAFEDARMRFDVRYYLVAILFILFDLEIAFLFPWAVVLQEIGMFGFVSMMIFLAILVVGFVYEWKKGALEWE
jgi:NADH-quinone oxidoreductase subunit A